jgi:hypothetical protein
MLFYGISTKDEPINLSSASQYPLFYHKYDAWGISGIIKQAWF